MGENLDDGLTLLLELLSTSRALTREIDRELGSWHGLGLRDLELLVELHGEPTKRLQLGELAARLEMAPSDLLRLLSPLERIGLVERVKDESDARRTEIVLSEAGVEATVNALATASETVSGVLDPRWSPAQQHSLRDLLALKATQKP